MIMALVGEWLMDCCNYLADYSPKNSEKYDTVMKEKSRMC